MKFVLRAVHEDESIWAVVTIDASRLNDVVKKQKALHKEKTTNPDLKAHIYDNDWATYYEDLEPETENMNQPSHGVFVTGDETEIKGRGIRAYSPEVRVYENCISFSMYPKDCWTRVETFALPTTTIHVAMTLKE